MFGMMLACGRRNNFNVGLVSGNYALVRDVQPNNTASGTLTTGAWYTRTLNTVEYDPTSIILELTSNQMRLAAGNYHALVLCPGFRCGLFQTRLSDSGGNEIALGHLMFSHTTVSGDNAYTNVGSSSILDIPFTLNSEILVEVQQRCSVTFATTGRGVRDNFTGENNFYASILVRKT